MTATSLVRPAIRIIVLMLLLALSGRQTLGQVIAVGEVASPVSPDMAVLELDLPAGATVMLDGKDQGKGRTITFKSLKPNVPVQRELAIRFRDGSTSTRQLLIRGGQRIRLPLRDPATSVPEIVPQVGDEEVRLAAFSPNGRHLLTVRHAEIRGAIIDTAVLWDAERGLRLRSYRGQQDGVAELTAIAFSPNGKQFAMVGGHYDSKDGVALLWDVATGKLVRRLAAPHDQANSVAFSADGRRLVVGYQDDHAVMWDLNTGKSLLTIKGGFGNAVLSVDIDARGRQVATAGASGEGAHLWDAKDGKHILELEDSRKLEGGPLPIFNSIQFSPDGRHVLGASGRDHDVLVWDAASGKVLKRLRSSKEAYSARYSQSGKLIVSNGDGEAVVWDAASGQALRTFPGEMFAPALAIDPAEARMLVHKTLFDLATGRALRTFESQGEAVSKIRISADGTRLAVHLHKGDSYSTTVWDLAAGRLLAHFPRGTIYARTLSFSPDGRHLLAAADLWDVETGQKVRSFAGHESGAACEAFSADGRLAVTGGAIDNTAILWDVSTGERRQTFTGGHTTTLAGVAISPDGLRVLTVGEYGEAVLWDAANGRLIHKWDMRQNPILGDVAFTRDSREALTAAEGGGVLWDVASGQSVRKLKGHRDGVRSGALGFDGRWALTGSDDRGAILWETATGTRLRTLAGHQGAVFGVAFSPDARLAYTGSGDATVRIWDLATGEELAQLITLEDGKDWMVVSPTGFFDGSAGGSDKVTFRVGGGLGVVPVDRFFQDFYRPGLLATISQGERPTPEVEIGTSLPPKLRIAAPEPGAMIDAQSVTIQVEAEDAGGGIKGPELRQNGARILAAGEASRQEKVLLQSFEVRLVAGDNQITVTAASADGSWESEPAEITLRHEPPSGTAGNASPELYMAAIGVSRYAEPSLKLNFAAQDAKRLAEVFAERGKGLYGSVHVETHLDAQATRKGVREAILAARSARPQDTLVVFISGHGVTVGQRYYFLPHDFKAAGGAFEEDVRRTGLPIDELGDALRSVPALKRILILDTCGSGGAIARTGGLAKNPFAFQKAIQRLNRSEGVFTIAACASTEETVEVPILKHGVLTYALLAGLRAVNHGPLADKWVEPNNPEQVVGVLEWLSFADGEVPRLTSKIIGKPQDVELSAQGNSFPVLPLRTE